MLSLACSSVEACSVLTASQVAAHLPAADGEVNAEPVVLEALSPGLERALRVTCAFVLVGASLGIRLVGERRLMFVQSLNLRDQSEIDIFLDFN